MSTWYETKVVPFNLDKCLADGGRCFTNKGDPARIIATDRKGGSHKLVALITEQGGNEYCHVFKEDGTHTTSGSTGLHLVLRELHRTVEGHAVVYRYKSGEVVLARTPAGLSHDEAIEYFESAFDQSWCEFLGVAKYTVEMKA